MAARAAGRAAGPARALAAVAVALAAGVALGCAAAGGGASRSVALPAQAALAGRPERLVLVSIHGLGPEAYLPGSAAVAAPTLASLGAAGVLAEAVAPVFPAASHPAHVSLVTGSTPARHGIASDHPIDEERGVSPLRFEQAAAIQGRTLWQAVAEAGSAVAALDWPSTGGAAIAELLPDVDSARRGAGWGELLARTGTPRAVDLARRAGADDPRSALPGPQRDAVLVEVACALLAAEPAPRLLLLRLSQVEGALARAAPGSEAARRALAGADAEVARLVGCLARAGRLATTALVVAGDHGLVPLHTAVRANAVLAAAGLVRADPGGVTGWDALARSNGGSAFVYAHSAEAAISARQALEDSARATGAFRVVSAEEMLGRGADPEAWFGLDTWPGFAFDDAPAGATIGPATAFGAGGYAPGEPRMNAGLVAWGAGLRAGVRVPAMRQIDVAPTLARLLGVGLDGAEGRAMVGLLREGRAGAEGPAVAPAPAPARRRRAPE